MLGSTDNATAKTTTLQKIGDQRAITGYVGMFIVLFGPLMMIEAVRNGWLNYQASTALFVWMLLASLVIGAVDYFAHRHLHAKFIAAKRDFASLLAPAVVRWLGWMVILTIAYGCYSQLSLYGGEWYQSFRELFLLGWKIWAVAGIPYYLLVLGQRYGVRWDRSDPAVLIMCILRRLLYYVIKPGSQHAQLRRLCWRHRKARVAWLGLLVKGFFLPLMLIFFINNADDSYTALVRLLQNTATAIRSHNYAPVYNNLFDWCYHSLFLIDVTLATMGYYLSTRLLNNGIQSVESTGMGWLSCIACYPPWNTVTGWYLRWPSENITALPDSTSKYVLMIAILSLIAIYVWATLAFGLRYSNLTYRGMITCGPYRWCRHPAYMAKNASWWLEYLPSFSSIGAMVGMLGWTIMYGVRAYTEERHLRSVEPKYDQYCQQVRYRFVPGLW